MQVRGVAVSVDVQKSIVKLWGDGCSEAELAVRFRQRNTKLSRLQCQAVVASVLAVCVRNPY